MKAKFACVIVFWIVSFTATARTKSDPQDHAFTQAQEEFVSGANPGRKVEPSDPATVYARLETDFFSEESNAFKGVPTASFVPPHGLLCATRSRVFAAILCTQPPTIPGTSAPYIRVIPDLEKEPEHYRKLTQERVATLAANTKLNQEAMKPEYSKVKYLSGARLEKLNPAEKEAHARYQEIKRQISELDAKTRNSFALGKDAFDKCYKTENNLNTPLSTDNSPMYQWDSQVREISNSDKSITKKVDFFTAWQSDPIKEDSPRISKAYSVVRDERMIVKVPINIEGRPDTAMCVSAKFMIPDYREKLRKK